LLATVKARVAQYLQMEKDLQEDQGPGSKMPQKQRKAKPAERRVALIVVYRFIADCAQIAAISFFA